jgi:hypothetical protein
MVVASDLYRIGESASQAGFPNAFLKVAGAKLSLPTLKPIYTFESLTELSPALLDPASM